MILKNHAGYKQKLAEYLKPVRVRGKQWQLCFRASEHQYSARAFYEKCVNKGPTVTLVRVADHVFGGYIDQSWDKRGELVSTNPDGGGGGGGYFHM